MVYNTIEVLQSCKFNFSPSKLTAEHFKIQTFSEHKFHKLDDSQLIDDGMKPNWDTGSQNLKENCVIVSLYLIPYFSSDTRVILPQTRRSNTKTSVDLYHQISTSSVSLTFSLLSGVGFMTSHIIAMTSGDDVNVTRFYNIEWTTLKNIVLEMIFCYLRHYDKLPEDA